jgi:hypothetical protein
MNINKKLIKAIRAKCLECSGGQRKEVKLCPIKSCPLWPYRLSLTLLDDEDIGINNKEEIDSVLNEVDVKAKKEKKVKKKGRNLLGF